MAFSLTRYDEAPSRYTMKAPGVEQWWMKMEELLFLGGLAVDIFFQQGGV